MHLRIKLVFETNFSLLMKNHLEAYILSLKKCHYRKFTNHLIFKSLIGHLFDT